MKLETVARENAMFFVTVVGMSLGMKYFDMAVLDSSMKKSQFPTENAGSPGYIIIDSSLIRKRGDKLWFEFTDKIRAGLFIKVSYEFSSATKFEGDLAEQVTIKSVGYTFSFLIKKYERDSAHGFEIIGPENLGDVPEEEKLGRVAYLTIEIDK